MSKFTNNQAVTSNLYQKTRIYKDVTHLSYYFQKNGKVKKKFKPVDIDGCRYRQNLETGEITCYSKKDIINTTNCSMRRTKISINELLLMNDFDWFWTLTFDKSRIDRTNDEAVFECYKKYIDNLNHKFKTFRYICFPERHKDKCIHFHLLVGGITAKQMGLVNSGKVCCSWATFKDKVASREYFERTKHLHEHELKETDGEPIYNVTTFAYGFTTVSRIVSRERCNSYVKKYVEKDLGTTGVFKKRFYYSQNLEVPVEVKELIGAGFDNPIALDKYDELMKNPLITNAKYEPYFSDYNVLQVTIGNDIKKLIDNGIVPLSQEEIEKLGDIF